MKTNTKPALKANQQNNLWQSRRRAGLERKQVSFLLSKNTTDELSHYERGDYLPNLKTALELEIIYKMPIRLLFHQLFGELEAKINRLKAENHLLITNFDWLPTSAQQLEQEEPCFYTKLLKSHIPNELEIRTVIKHILALNNSITDFKQGRNPFADNQLNRKDL